MKTILRVIPIVLSIFLTSCSDLFEPPQWKTDIYAPIAKSSLSLNDIATDYMSTNPDSSLTLVYENELYSLTVDSLVNINVKPFFRKLTVDSLRLSDQTIVETITLGEIAQQDNSVGPLIIAFHGNQFPIPAIDNLSAGPVSIDAAEILNTATLESGTMTITIDNDLPTDIDNLIFEITNQVDNSVISNGTFVNIPAGGTEQQIIDLAGKTITGLMDISITNLDVVGTGGVFVDIDTSDALVATMEISDLKVQEATAIFPEQVLIDETTEIPLTGLGDVVLTEATMSGGVAILEATSTAEDVMFLQYTIPDATLNGVPFDTILQIAPAPPGGVSTISLEVSFEGYDFEFENNEFTNVLKAWIDSSGIMRTLTQEDSVVLDVEVKDLEASYAKGYFGQETFDIGPDTTKLDIFKNILSGGLDIENSNLVLRVENSLGIEGSVTINDLTAINTKTNGKVILDQSSKSFPSIITSATEVPFEASTTELIYTDANSNPSELIELLPDEISFDLQVETNPSGNTGAYDNFAFEFSDLTAYLDMEIPLSLITNDLVLSDTVQLNSTTFKPEEIKNGTFTFLVDNGLPMDVDFKVFFLNEFDEKVDSLDAEELIEAAIVNSAGKVETNTTSKIDFYISEEKMSNLFSASQIVFWADVTTKPSTEHLKIYNYYSLDFKLIGDFEYLVQK